MTRKTILVVDDDPTHLLCARDLLEADGYEVVVHQYAFGATEKVLVERPDLVLVDVNMPALSGEGLVGVIRNRPRLKELPVVLYSSNDEESLRRTAERLGLRGFVCKGDVEALRTTVARLVG